MVKDIFKNYIYPISVFSGGVIGVGFLSLPYVAMQSGIWLMLGYFIVLTSLIVVINLIFCDISLKTPDFKRFPGFVGYYLGKRAETFTMIVTILGGIAVLLAYMLIGVQFFSSVFQPIFPISTLAIVLVYFLIVTIIICFDIKVVSRVEFWALILLFLSLFFIFIKGFSHIQFGNIFPFNFKFNASKLFLPYGPLLFALWGVGLIPEVEEMIRGNKKRLKRIITISTIIISVFYFLFTILILGITGIHTEQSALSGLKGVLGNTLVSVALLVGAIVSITAFITQGIITKKTLVFDLKIKHWQAIVMTCCTPLVLFLLGFTSFIPIISFIGAILLGIDGVLILLMYKKIACLPAGRAVKNVTIWALFLVFILGVIYEVAYFVK